eukprot:GHRQ01033529.1.p2 GENE.GHRQ01033529.1~~GHRQ01033529.1.p2  ORF type:complete len:114 (+),score=20.71 GHRQ01033529.1:229-570(+)
MHHRAQQVQPESFHNGKNQHVLSQVESFRASSTWQTLQAAITGTEPANNACMAQPAKTASNSAIRLQRSIAHRKHAGLHAERHATSMDCILHVQCCSVATIAAAAPAAATSVS